MFQTVLNSYDVFCDLNRISKDCVTKSGEFNSVRYDYMQIENHKCLTNIYSTNPYDYLTFLNKKQSQF